MTFTNTPKGKKMLEKNEIKKILYLPIETVNRELDGRLLLALEAIQNGFKVVIGRKRFVKDAVKKYKSGVIINKDANKPLKSDYNSNIDDLLFVYLDEENLVNRNDEFFRFLPKEFRNYHDLIFAWGLKQAKVLTEYKKVPKPLVHVVGNPRFDVCKLIRDKEENKNNDDYVLINTNFAIFNRSKFYQDSYENQIIEITNRSNIKTSHDSKYYQEIEKYIKSIFYEYVKMLKYFNENHKDIKFILRPHPSEDIKLWEKELHSLNNVEVVQKGSVHDWIKSSKCVIHTGCTTAIETVIMGQVAIQFNPIYNEKFESHLPNELSVKAIDYNQLYKALVNPEALESLSLLDDYLYNWNNKDSSKKIMDVLNKSVKYKNFEIIQKLPRVDSLMTRLLYFFASSAFKSPLQLVFSSRLKGLLRKYPFITKKFLINRLNKIVTPDDSKSSYRIKVKAVAPDTFLIEK